MNALTHQVVDKNISTSSSDLVEQVLQCQMETNFQIEKLEVQAAKCGKVSERMSCNLRVKGLKILKARLESVVGMNTTLPSVEEIDWARKHFGLI